MATKVRDVTKLEVDTLAQYVCSALVELGVCGRITDYEPYNIEVMSYDDAPLGSIQVLEDGGRVYELEKPSCADVEKALHDVLQEDGQL